MKKVMGLILGVVPFSINAQCIQAPDCASIGYTETSCDGDSLKCPFDISKLYCVPCDSSFKYSCDGENVLGGIGSSCAGKYVICDCDEGYYLKDNQCVESCDVGEIYYADGSCSFELDEDKIVLGVVVKSNELIMATDIGGGAWSATAVDLVGINKITNPRLDYDGKKHTQAVVDYYGTEAENNAAVYCYNYTPTGDSSSLNKWYLPAIGELAYISYNISTIRNTFVEVLGHSSFSYWAWSSSEFDNDDVYRLDINTASVYTGSKWHGYTVICFLEI